MAWLPAVRCSARTRLASSGAPGAAYGARPVTPLGMAQSARAGAGAAAGVGSAAGASGRDTAQFNILDIPRLRQPGGTAIEACQFVTSACRWQCGGGEYIRC